jgi:hypothetical protein
MTETTPPPEDKKLVDLRRSIKNPLLRPFAGFLESLLSVKGSTTSIPAHGR